MSLLVECAKCHQELNDPGALLFGPPDRGDATKKYHLCTQCYVDIVNVIAGKYMSERVEELETALTALLDAQFHALTALLDAQFHADRSLDLARGRVRELLHKE